MTAAEESPGQHARRQPAGAKRCTGDEEPHDRRCSRRAILPPDVAATDAAAATSRVSSSSTDRSNLAANLKCTSALTQTGGRERDDDHMPGASSRTMHHVQVYACLLCSPFLWCSWRRVVVRMRCDRGGRRRELSDQDETSGWLLVSGVGSLRLRRRLCALLDAHETAPTRRRNALRGDLRQNREGDVCLSHTHTRTESFTAADDGVPSYAAAGRG